MSHLFIFPLKEENIPYKVVAAPTDAFNAQL